ncbi:MAG TPA: isoprenylcysteine carboxylmethyltransferase family protein [Candidatus Binataceae bacterium]|nr:isoprenylcysteine carboxylmethyltransferase family protein [Candidatus Binataceae bacterium]
MHDDHPFRLALATLLALTAAIRVYYQAQSFESGRGSEEFEGWLNVTLRSIAGLAGFAALITYLVSPARMAWAALPLPGWLRWLGAPVGAVGVAGLWRVHRELGRNFRGTLHLRPEHRLVTSGPYRWVRHPMYTAIYAILISFLLLSANWFIGGGFIAVFTAVIVSRLPREEAVMTARFGDEYRAYMARTGRLLPRRGA